MDPMKHLYEAPSLVVKLAKWLILLTEFDVQHLTKKIIKGRAVTEFLALNTIPDLEEIQLDFPDDLNTAIEVQGWRMYFDGVVNQFEAGIGVILLTPEEEVVPIAKKLAFRVTNNKAEIIVHNLIRMHSTQISLIRIHIIDH